MTEKKKKKKKKRSRGVTYAYVCVKFLELLLRKIRIHN